VITNTLFIDFYLLFTHVYVHVCVNNSRFVISGFVCLSFTFTLWKRYFWHAIITECFVAVFNECFVIFFPLFIKIFFFSDLLPRSFTSLLARTFGEVHLPSSNFGECSTIFTYGERSTNIRRTSAKMWTWWKLSVNVRRIFNCFFQF
jgi:hypothetical protein